jgi:DNA-binding FadR family transcriptional regulator
MQELIQRRKLSAEIKDRLLAMIREGGLRPGDRLPSERELMGRYGVGRPAVREAMQSLESDGLIEINHGERAMVVKPDERDIISRIGETALHLLQTSPEALGHLREARLLFEVGMVRTAARKASEEEISRLEEILRRQRTSYTDPAGFVAADMAFHSAIATVSGNPIIVAVSESMLQWLFRFRSDMLRVKGAERITLVEHRRILDAIRAHDEDAATKAMTEHLSRSNARYSALLSA